MSADLRVESAPEPHNAIIVSVRQVCLDFLELGQVCCCSLISLLYFLEFLVCHFLGVDFPERIFHVDLELVPCHLQSALEGDQWLEPVPDDSFE